MDNNITKKIIKLGKNPQKRKQIINFEKKISNNEKLLLNNYQEEYDKIRKMFMEIKFQHENMYKSRIREKLNSYLYQDKKKMRETDNNINFEELIEKLLICKLKCFYCKCNLCLINENVRQDNMWTLDRIDNDLSHTNNNTCISCLKCNLQKRKRSHEKFKFTKQLKVHKEKNDDNKNNN